MAVDFVKHLEVQRRLAEHGQSDPQVERLVTEVIERVADKWTMVIIDVLAERGELRFSELTAHVPGISQKVLTQKLRGMEREGLVVRTVHAEVPPRVQYRLTPLGLGLGAAFCGVWVWAQQHLGEIQDARRSFDRTRRSRKRVR